MGTVQDKRGRFDYFYGRAAESYQFFRIPKVLVTDTRYKNVSRDAKLLYGLLLDRAALSYKNGWIDDNGRVYIIFSIEEIMADLCCSNKTAVKFLSELDTVRGIGLIEKVRRGRGEKSWIYVKDFTTDIIEPEEPEYDKEGAFEDVQAEEGDAEESLENSAETLENTEKCKNYTSRSVADEEVKKVHFKKCKNYTSRNVKSTLQEVKKVHFHNNTNSNNTKGVILSRQSPARARDDDGTENKISKVENEVSEIFERTGLCNSDTASDDYSDVIQTAVRKAIIAIFEEDEDSGREDRIRLLHSATEQDINDVCERIGRYSGSISSLPNYAATVLIDVLSGEKKDYGWHGERRGSGRQEGCSGGNNGYRGYNGASWERKPRKQSFNERHYTQEFYDELESRLLKESGMSAL